MNQQRITKKACTLFCCYLTINNNYLLVDKLVLSTGLSITPSLKRVKELWVVCGLYTEI